MNVQRFQSNACQTFSVQCTSDIFCAMHIKRFCAMRVKRFLANLLLVYCMYRLNSLNACIRPEHIRYFPANWKLLNLLNYEDTQQFY